MKIRWFFIPLGYLVFSGIFFNGLLFHELIHIIQSKNPTKFCYNIGTNNWMEVHHGIEDFESFQLYSEKWAEFGQRMFMFSIVLVVSYLMFKHVK